MGEPGRLTGVSGILYGVVYRLVWGFPPRERVRVRVRLSVWDGHVTGMEGGARKKAVAGRKFRTEVHSGAIISLAGANRLR